MFRGKGSDRGQVLIIFVFAIIGLVGITGLAIDGGNIYSDRRHAQNAADTAALAAAVTRVTSEKGGASISDCSNLTGGGSCGLAVLAAAQAMAKTNGYDWTDLARDSVEVHTPPIDGTYSDCTQVSFNCRDYVEVIITSNLDTFFARVLGITQLHNTVEAVALAKYRPSGALYGGYALVVLAPHSVSGLSGEFNTKGNATINLYGGGVFVNSDGATSFTETSGCVTFNLNGQQIVGLGGQKTDSCPTAPTLYHTSQGLQFPPDTIFPEPTECGLTPAASTTDADGYTHLYPGHYSSLPPSKNTRLDPGVYCVDSLVKTTNPNSNFVGNGVFIYIRPNGSFDIQGGLVQLSAPASGKYAGWLFYVASDYTGTAPNCTINGAAGDTITGVIYAPYCDLTINGGSASVGLTAQVVAYTITLTGSSSLTFTYNPNNAAMTPVIDWTGLYH